MKVLYSLKHFAGYKKPVVAIGVFDGVHLAHKIILKHLVKQARRIKGRSMVLTFGQHPQKEEILHSLEQRLKIMDELGIDICIVINFNKRFFQASAEDFIKNILVDRLKPSYVYVGSNFRFGRGAKGNVGILKKLSRIYNFKLKVFNVIKRDNRVISSTNIRRLIRKGNFKAAQRLLTSPVTISGKVIKGSSLGEILGFPTANITPGHKVLLPKGVYAVKIILAQHILNGVCYIGSRPTFTTTPKSLVWGFTPKNYLPAIKKIKNIEVHLFNFHKNIYGKEIEIQFIKKIREERRFVSCIALVKQIKKDVNQAKKLFSCH